MYHWSELSSGYLLFYNDYVSNLPIRGWMHLCINCYCKTSKIYPYYKYFNSNDLPVSIIICKECVNHNKIPHDEIIQQINSKNKY